MTDAERTTYGAAVGQRLRAIRLQQGLSLHGVERKSDGRWKAVVVGSYERGDRSVTVPRLAALADFYGVPLTELLPDCPSGELVPPPQARLVIDLTKLGDLPPDRGAPLVRFAATIQGQRGDYNGRVLSIRGDDLRSLAVIYEQSPAELADNLVAWGVLSS